jgi:hypothetical protein
MTPIIADELNLFIEEARRLSARSFYQHFQQGEDISFSDGSVPDNSPTEEQMESYLLHFRKFLQKKDRVSIYKVDGYFRELCGDSLELLEKWEIVYGVFIDFLDAKVLTGRIIRHDDSIPALKLIDLYDVRTFGDLSHLDRNKQPIHSKLSQTPQLEAMYRFEYFTFLAEVGELIAEMAVLCGHLLSSRPDH